MNLIPTSTRPATITLYQGVPFDNKYKEHTLLSTKFNYENRQVSFNKNSFLDLKIEDSDEYYYPRTTKEGTFNFQYGNGLVTAITLELDGDEINSNYMRVSIRGALPSRTISYYYFITGLTQKNETTYLLNLELDVIQTFGDEFLTNMLDKPVFTERKHCTRVLPNGRPQCADLVKTENQFSGVKANHIERVEHLKLNIFDSANFRVPNINWVYIVMTEPSGSQASLTAIEYSYRENGVTYPYIIKCLPLVDNLEVLNSNGATILTYDIPFNLRLLCVSERVVKVFISPYPPFDDLTNCRMNLSLINNSRKLLWRINDYTGTIQNTSFTTDIGTNCKIHFEYTPSTAQVGGSTSITLIKGFGGKLPFDEIDLFHINNMTEPSIENTRDVNEYKKILPPFRRYFLESFSTEGCEFNPQIRFNKKWSIAPDYVWKNYQAYAVVSHTAESNFTFVTMQDQVNPFETKQGDGGNINYLLPTGANAYEHFMNTANAEYTQSKIVSGLSNVVKIGAGVGALALSSTGIGAVAGVAGIVSGAVGIGNDITSYVSKMEDLKNTANTFNLSGSSFARDFAMAYASDNYDLYPYVITYATDEVVLESAMDYFYEYGYEVNRDCYFNTQLYRGINQQIVDNNIFNRTNFNYVKIKDDITMKCLGSNLPLIIAKKFNEIFNNGIKLWTFFGNGCLQTGENYDGMYNVYRYFQKHKYDNAEFYDQYE